MNNKQEVEFLRFTKLLSDNECLEHVILIGSWAEYIYKEAGLLKDYEPNIVTRDIDFLVKNMHKPKIPKNITTLAKEAGYTTDQDYLNGTTKIYSCFGLEMEFLINQQGRGCVPVLKTNLGVNAQALRHMNILLNNAVKVFCYEMCISVPMPEAYVIHKMVINADRKQKREKDVATIKKMYAYLDKKKFAEILETLTQKEKNSVTCFLSQNIEG